MDDKKLFELEKHRENPFVAEMIERVQSSTVVKLQGGKPSDRKGVAGLVDTTSGELVEATFVRKKEVDSDQFVKLYCGSVALWADLSKPALKVFTWIVKNIKPQCDFIIIARDVILPEIGYKSSETLYRGLRELVKGGIIAKGQVDGMWFINPLVVFNGDRATFATKIIKKKDPTLKAKTIQGLTNEISRKLERERKENSGWNQLPIPDHML